MRLQMEHHKRAFVDANDERKAKENNNNNNCK